MQCFHLTHTILAWYNFYINSIDKTMLIVCRYLNDKIKYYFIRMATSSSEKSRMDKRTKIEDASHVLYKILKESFTYFVCRGYFSKKIQP